MVPVGPVRQPGQGSADPGVAGADRPTSLRVVGLLGSTLMAVGTFTAGALPGGDPGAAASSTYWLGLVGWLVGLLALSAAWWRLGAALRRSEPAASLHRPGPALPLRWLLVTGALWAAPLLVAPPAGSRDIYSYACQGALWLDGADPYSLGVAAGGCAWTDAVPVLWRDTSTPYGPLALALSGVVVAAARAVVGSTDAQLLVAVGLLRAVALAGGVLIALYLPRLARACGVDPRLAIWLGLLSPLVAVHLVSGAHNDALMVGLVITALALLTSPGVGYESTPPVATALLPAGAARAAGIPGLTVLLAAGAALGLATAVKVTALVAVPFAILLAAGRHPVTGRGVVGRAGAAILGAALLMFAGLSLATGLGLGWLGALSGTGRLVQWTSLPTGVGMAVGYLLRVVGHPEAVDMAVAVSRRLGLAALAAVAAALLFRAWRMAAGPPLTARRTVVTACGTTFAALAVLSPVFYPWYALAAIAVLAASVPEQRWARRLAAAALILSVLVLPNGLGLAVRTKLPGALFDFAVLVLLLVATGRAVRDGTLTGWFSRPTRPGRPGRLR